MTEDWTAVARAAKDRMFELGLKQREVEERADLSKATVREILNNVKPRRRKARTLEDLSVALGWNPGHLAAVLEGRTPPDVKAPPAKSANDIAGRLDVIEHRLNQMVEGLSSVNSLDDRVADRVDKRLDERLDVFAEMIETAVRKVVIGMRQPGR